MVTALLLILMSLPAGSAAAPNTLCASAASAQEDGRDIPAALMQAIALTESGRWAGGKAARFAWPWTVTAERKGRFFATRDAAMAHVRALLARGVRNIDVGCMQINLRYHPNAFASLEDAFDPDLNAAYAAQFLSRLKGETKSITSAVARYHTRDRARGRYYWKKVRKAWAEARRREYERQRAVLRARNADRRAQIAGRRNGPVSTKPERR